MALRARNKAGSMGQPPPSTKNEENPEKMETTTSAPKGNAPSSFCGWHLLALVPLLVAFLIYHIPTIYDEYMARMGLGYFFIVLLTCLSLLSSRYGQAPQFEVPTSVMQQFRVYDANADGRIDPYEFLAIIQDMNISLTEVSGNIVS